MKACFRKRDSVDAASAGAHREVALGEDLKLLSLDYPACVLCMPERGLGQSLKLPSPAGMASHDYRDSMQTSWGVACLAQSPPESPLAS